MSYKRALLVVSLEGALGEWIKSCFVKAFREESLGMGEVWDLLVWDGSRDTLELVGKSQGVVVVSGGDGGVGGLVLGYARALGIPGVGLDLEGGKGFSPLAGLGFDPLIIESLGDPRAWSITAREVLKRLSPQGEPPRYPGLVRHGLDIEPPRGYQGICQTFGNIEDYIRDDGTLSPSWEEEVLALARIPFSIPLSWDPSSKARRIRCHKLLVPVFEALFQEVVERGLRPLVRTYGGCYCFRRMRGGSHLSTHSWGIAIDLNPDTNPLGSPGDMAPELVGLFQEFGFTWGGRFTRPDPMHFQFCSEY